MLGGATSPRTGTRTLHLHSPPRTKQSARDKTITTIALSKNEAHHPTSPFPIQPAHHATMLHPEPTPSETPTQLPQSTTHSQAKRPNTETPHPFGNRPAGAAKIRHSASPHTYSLHAVSASPAKPPSSTSKQRARQEMCGGGPGGEVNDECGRRIAMEKQRLDALIRPPPGSEPWGPVRFGRGGGVVARIGLVRSAGEMMFTVDVMVMVSGGGDRRLGKVGCGSPRAGREPGWGSGGGRVCGCCCRCCAS
ncbi:hypothetical protein BT67DRAFT_148806 [Trichocladium antarcticum]|uniref:Uncharacterized protein n=1 Tax=Trichocladium antarcticum TaxID=1450529 RepID=A0AAN6UEW8_9PEZI|nr:hypothetical protein BT67DRAFT_148806 [Trichocladium antarcticum]